MPAVVHIIAPQQVFYIFFKIAVLKPDPDVLSLSEGQ
jgi:hypothetical protein